MTAIYKNLTLEPHLKSMEFTARQVSDLLQGVVEGDAGVKVDRLSKIEEGTPGSLSFLANPKYAQFIYSTNASAVIVNADFVPEHPVKATLIRVENAYQSFVKLLEIYNQIQRDKKGIEQPSYIATNAQMGRIVMLGHLHTSGKMLRLEITLRFTHRLLSGTM